MNNENLNTNLYVEQKQMNNNVFQSANQEQLVQNNKTRKDNKKLLIIGTILGVIVLGIIVVFLIGLFGNSNSPDKVVKKYVTALIEKKYDDAFNYIFLPENSFVDSDDYFDYIKTKNYFSTISDNKIGSIKENYTRDLESEYKLSLKDLNNIETYYKVQLQKNYKGEWKIVESGLYITDWSIILPKDTDLFIDDKKVESTCISEYDELKNKIILPAITSTKKTFKLVNKLQTKEIEYTPLPSNSEKTMFLELTDNDLTRKAYDFVKDTWNNMYTDYINGVDVSDVAKKYFVDNIDIEMVNTYYTKSFDNLTKGSSGYKTNNYVLIEVVARPGAYNYVNTGNVIGLNFGYKLTWNWTFNNDFRTMTNFSQIRLKIEGDSFKIYEVLDENLFKYSNQFTKKY